MQIINLAVLTATLAATGALAWTQDAAGVWVANNAWRDDLNGVHKVHESCAERDGSRNLEDGASCAFWTDNNGGLYKGICWLKDDKIDCIQGCPDPFSPCQYANSEGNCEFGYAACLQTMGCNGRSGEADCLGTATGCAAAC